MAANNNPTVTRRRPGAELRRLRKASGLTGTQAAAQLLTSQAKVSHVETGRRAVSPRDVRDLCRLYGVTEQQIAAHARPHGPQATATWGRCPHCSPGRSAA